VILLYQNRSDYILKGSDDGSPVIAVSNIISQHPVALNIKIYFS
jgi:hypothetical protein